MWAFISRIFIVLSVCIFCTDSFARWEKPNRKFLDLSNTHALEIEVPHNATEFEKEVANILKQEFKKVLNKHAVQRNNLSTTPLIAKIILQNTHCLDKNLSISELLKSNNYLIRVGNNVITLEYPSADKIGWVVGKFLRDFCNIKYFSPSPFGTEYGYTSLKFKKGEYRFSPSYFAACFSDFNTSKRWRILNGIDTQYTYFKFSHNLNNIISPKDFQETPHLFALKKNIDNSLTPYIYGQPDLLNYQTQTKVANEALKYFANHQHTKMFSIGINDTQTVDERSEYLLYKDGYFRGYPNWSNAVFEFSNEVAKRVSKQKPNAILGLLAYMICEKPPKFKLEKNLIPFYTTDRSNNYLEKYQKQDFEILQQWGQSGVETFGIYEYLYGLPYLMPRDFSEKSTTAIKFAHNSKARLYYAETYSLWAFDVKKMWITARILEDCSLQYEALEKQFYAEYFKSASKPMQEFFNTSNSIWKTRKIPNRWLALYKAENALLLLNKAQLLKMSEALKEAKKLAELDSDKNIARRVEEIVKCFKITQSAYNLHIAKTEMSDLLQANASTQKLISALKKYDSLKTEFLTAQNDAQNEYLHIQKFNIYNQERFAPLDKLAKHLLINGITQQDISKLNLKNVDLKSTFTAIEEIEKHSLYSYSISKWGNFKSNFSVLHKDFENAFMDTENNTLTFKNCELSGIAKNFFIKEHTKIIFEGRVENVCTAGTLCYASLVFLDTNNIELKRKTLIFNSRKNIDFTLADMAPLKTQKANISIYATRQKSGDIFKVKEVNVRIAE